MYHWKGFFAFASVCFVFLIVTLDSSNVSGEQWVNNWDQPFNYQCRLAGYSISRLRSIHSNHHEDRRWAFSCIDNKLQSTRCHWTHYNEYDAKIHQICAYNGFIAGVKSHHHNGHEDRQYSFKCCDANGQDYLQCHWTGWENNWDAELHYYVPHTYYLRGIESVHDNGREDRRWKFYVCRKSP